MKEQIKEYINDAMKRYFRSDINIEYMHDRLDELFLLYSYLEHQTFVNTTAEFEISYKDFSDHSHLRTKAQILKKFPELNEYFEDSAEIGTKEK